MTSARMGSVAAAPGQGNNWTHADTHMCRHPPSRGTSGRALPGPGQDEVPPTTLHGLPELLPWAEAEGPGCPGAGLGG